MQCFDVSHVYILFVHEFSVPKDIFEKMHKHRCEILGIIFNR